MTRVIKRERYSYPSTVARLASKTTKIRSVLLKFTLSVACICFLSITTQAEDDHGDSIADATSIGIYSSTEGYIDTSDDLDVFRVNVTQFGFLRASTNSNLDTLGRLLSKDGRVLGQDDDSGTDRNFILEFDVEPGDLFIEVSGYGDDDIGRYTLNVEFDVREENVLTTTRLGDFNGDGSDDILLRNLDGRWYLYPMNGSEYQIDGRGFVPLTRDLNYGLAGIGDFDGDGNDDVALRHLDGRFKFYFMNGLRFHQQLDFEDEEVSTDFQIVGVGRFDSFNDDDEIVLRHRLTGTWIKLEFRTFFSEYEASVDDFEFRDLSTDTDKNVVGLGDFDGNGVRDFLMRQADGRWYYIMIGTSFSNKVLEEGFLSLEEDISYGLAGIGDFNGDGKDDILLRHKDGSWLYYAMDGSKFIKDENGEASLPNDLDLRVAGVGDLNADAVDDLILRHIETGAWHYYPMAGRNPIADQVAELNIATSQLWRLPVTNPRATIAGRLLITKGQILDSDTGDPSDPQRQNDTIQSAQTIRIPSAVAGYMMEEIDTKDMFRVRLPTRKAKTRISLVIADSNVDFDLHLADENGTVVGEALGLTELEVVETTRSGWHIVVVSAVEGESNYSLVISTQLIVEEGGATSSSYTVSTDGSFEPKQLVVETQAVVAEFKSDARVQDFKLEYAKQTSFGSSILMLKSDDVRNPNDLSHSFLESFQYSDYDQKRRGALLYLRKKLNIDDTVINADLNYLVSADIEPNDPIFEAQWHYDAIHLAEAWDYTTGDDGVVVAVIDTGILPFHPDLAPRLLRDDGKVAGFDFISDPYNANDGDGRDDDPSDPGDAEFLWQVDSFHGTHVAGTVAMASNNSQGGAGVSWQGKLLTVRVLGKTGGNSVDIAEAIRYAAGLRNDSGTLPPKRADVINLSLGFGNEYCLPTSPLPSQYRRAYQDAIRAGSIVVKSAGNDDCSYPSPASYIEEIVVVGATDYRNERSYYSNYGPAIDVVAPGGDVRADLNDDGYNDGVLSTLGEKIGNSVEYTYERYMGTSMAAPHMAGVVSLMKAVNPNLTPEDVNRLLNNSHPHSLAAPITTDIGARGRDPEFGNGLINAYRAVQIARAIAGGAPTLPTDPKLALSPRHLSFGTVTETLRVNIENIGFGTLEVTEIEADVDWIIVQNQDSVLVFTVDRFGLDEGTHLGTVRITSNGGIENVSVSIQVQRTNIEADVGTVYVQILDASNGERRGWATATVRGGYAFQIPVVDGGKYRVIAGSDRDGDGRICDSGEACGQWPLQDSPGILAVDKIAQIEFSVSIDLFARVSSQSFKSSQIAIEGIEIDRSLGGTSPNKK